MTDQHQAIAALIEAIKAGDGISIDDVGTVDAFDAKQILIALNAYNGSLDAALSLHKALLPGCGWGITSGNEYGAMCSISTGLPCVPCHGVTPARAWLLAILRAYASQLPAASNSKGSAA